MHCLVLGFTHVVYEGIDTQTSLAMMTPLNHINSRWSLQEVYVNPTETVDNKLCLNSYVFLFTIINYYYQASIEWYTA